MCYVIQFFATNVRAANIKSVLAFEVAVVAVLGCVVVSNQPVHLYGQFLPCSFALWASKASRPLVSTKRSIKAPPIAALREDNPCVSVGREIV